jgi:hypothetical protein
VLVGIARRQGDLDSGGHLGDPHRDLKQGEAERAELGLASERYLGRQIAQGMKESVGGDVDQQPELVCGQIRGTLAAARADQFGSDTITAQEDGRIVAGEGPIRPDQQ